MNLAHLYYFRKLVEVRNYSRAAQELFIAQPTLSLAVTSLERELGCALVKKKRNILELTEDGEDFYEAVVVAMNSLDNVTQKIRERSFAEAGTIRVGTVYSIQGQAWSAAIRDYHRAAKNHARIKWKQGTTESLMKDLKNGSLDVIMAGVLEKPDPEVESIPCFSQSAELLCHRAHPLATRKEVSLDELGAYPIITYAAKDGPFAREIASLLAGHPDLNVAFDYNDEITLASLVTADPHMLSIVCHSWLVDAFPDVATVTIKEAPVDFHRFYISYRKRERLSLAVEEFVDFMKDYDFVNVSPQAGEDEHVPIDLL